MLLCYYIELYRIITSGGSIPVFDEVIILMSRMNKVISLDEVGGTKSILLINSCTFYVVNCSCCVWFVACYSLTNVISSTCLVIGSIPILLFHIYLLVCIPYLVGGEFGVEFGELSVAKLNLSNEYLQVITYWLIY